MAITHSSNFQLNIAELKLLCNQLLAAPNLTEKYAIINSIPHIHHFLNTSLALRQHVETLDLKSQFLVKALLAIGQGSVVFQNFTGSKQDNTSFDRLLALIKEIDTFYDVIGGLIGYHMTVLSLIENQKNTPETDVNSEQIKYYKPEGIDISQNSAPTRQAVRWGIERLEALAEIYPIGGAGDRLHLQDEKTGELLPAAQLLFCGRSLLEGMIQDLQGREFLHYKFFGKQISTPLAIMTSHEKNNHAHIMHMCESNHWFGRNKNNFFFFTQILVPTITQDGLWAMQSPLNPILKPGGHGVIWKAALDHNLFEWLEDHGRTKALVRQINNPAAGVDNGLLALAGIGCHDNKKFGFSSCPRLVNMPEGMDVLCEKKTDQGYEYCITNIEYTDFEQRNIQDSPVSPGSPFSLFPANTNILFIDLPTIKSLIFSCSIPGMLINMKSKAICLLPDGSKEERCIGRLESTMQNIADSIVDFFPERLPPGKRSNLSSFITYNERKKTMSVAKQAFAPNKSFLGTPEGCHFEMMQNYYDLLTEKCLFELPPSRDEASYLLSGPILQAYFHPALGILYQIISQKLRGGRIAPGSEWIMEISEVDIANLDLKGSLHILADSMMGKKNKEGILIYDSINCGKCTLINVTVDNLGIQHSSGNIFWKHKISRQESLHIVLHGNAEFFAQNVTFTGNQHFEVPEGCRMTVEQKDGLIVSHTEKIENVTWAWNYSFNECDDIILKKTEQTIP